MQCIRELRLNFKCVINLLYSVLPRDQSSSPNDTIYFILDFLHNFGIMHEVLNSVGNSAWYRGESGEHHIN